MYLSWPLVIWSPKTDLNTRVNSLIKILIIVYIFLLFFYFSSHSVWSIKRRRQFWKISQREHLCCRSMQMMLMKEPMEKSHMVLCIKTARFLPSALIQEQVIIQVHLFNELIPCSMYAQLLYWEQKSRCLHCHSFIIRCCWNKSQDLKQNVLTQPF